jgi:hypothetical protein
MADDRREAGGRWKILVAAVTVSAGLTGLAAGAPAPFPDVEGEKKIRQGTRDLPVRPASATPTPLPGPNRRRSP